MGREIRMVPPNWQHPSVKRFNGRDGYQPMHDSTFADEAKEWKAEFAKWEAGERPHYYTPDPDVPDMEYWEWSGGPPDRAYYRPWADEEATWYQVWETVSEGTPVTPPFATREELVDYLVENGDYWDQQRRAERANGDYSDMSCEPWSRKDAEAFVMTSGCSVSLIVDSHGIRSGWRSSEGSDGND